MPNWGGGNSRAIEVKQQRNAVRLEKQRAEEKHKEDLAWKDDVTEAKLNKKEDAAAKHQEKLQRKLENRKLAEEEAEKVISNKKATKGPTKLTQAEIRQRTLLASLNASRNALATKKGTHQRHEVIDAMSIPIENPNRILQEEKNQAEQAGIEIVSASSVSDFLRATSTPTPPDRFIEKRMKAAFLTYEEEWLPRLKDEYPSLKRSQLKEKIWKQWQKAPENPMNAASAGLS